jgi:hypothetical protein
MDFRLEKAIHEYLASKGLVGTIDIISLAGGVKELAENPDGFVAGQLAASKRLHNIETVVLMNHIDCGAYGSFESSEAERAKHEADLETAKQTVLQKIAGVTVVKILAGKVSDTEWTFEELN